jgi:predicted small secreted protein
MPQAGLAAPNVGLGQDDFYIYSEAHMKTVLTALALVAGLAACNTRGGEDTARVGEGADTMVTPRTTQDTTIVSSDTTVRVETDTTVKEGDLKRDGATRRDTTHR